MRGNRRASSSQKRRRSRFIAPGIGARASENRHRTPTALCAAVTGERLSRLNAKEVDIVSIGGAKW